jgi:hypothetical protein
LRESPQYWDFALITSTDQSLVAGMIGLNSTKLGLPGNNKAGFLVVGAGLRIVCVTRSASGVSMLNANESLLDITCKRLEKG